ncbi:putative ATPase, AAA-type, core, P-loop containing nucleoside triphosphate hydrolase [Dioscorea sansibarensis]
MGNFLKFDIYGLELAGVRNATTLKKLLIETSNKSIIVIEDIDCTVPLENRDSEDMDDNDRNVTLSSLLNLVDGLWSSCGEEKIIMFTTNYKERLDHALLRPGRMDMHIYMGYCSPSIFRILAFNYRDVNKHPLFEKTETLIQEVEVTLATVMEELMRSDDCEVVFWRLFEYLRCKKKEIVEAIENNLDIYLMFL